MYLLVNLRSKIQYYDMKFVFYYLFYSLLTRENNLSWWRTKKKKRRQNRWQIYVTILRFLEGNALRGKELTSIAPKIDYGVRATTSI